jgi:hypothetical protein
MKFGKYWKYGHFYINTKTKSLSIALARIKKDPKWGNYYIDSKFIKEFAHWWPNFGIAIYSRGFDIWTGQILPFHIPGDS